MPVPQMIPGAQQQKEIARGDEHQLFLGGFNLDPGTVLTLEEIAIAQNCAGRQQQPNFFAAIQFYDLPAFSTRSKGEYQVRDVWRGSDHPGGCRESSELSHQKRK